MVVVSLLLLFGDAVAVVSVLAVDVEVDFDVDADAVSGVTPSMGCSVSSAAKKYHFIHIGDYFLRK